MRMNRLSSTIVLVITLVFIYMFTKNSHKIHRNELLNSINVQLFNKKAIYKKEDFVLKLSKDRLNKLFEILHEKEAVYDDILKDFNLISFNKLLENNEADAYYDNEINKYLIKKNNKIEATDSFIDYLYQMSYVKTFINNTKTDRHLYQKSLNQFDVKPVIVTAAHSGYFKPLEASVERIHKIFPNYELIIYDLGLEPDQLNKTILNCKCQVRKFDKDQKYVKKSEHIKKLKTYAWKPLIIQEVFNSHQTIVYIDSSIYFNSNEMKQSYDTAINIGMSSQLLGADLNYYTNPKMFKWFKEQPKDYEIKFLEANLLIFNRCFVTSLIMKSWVTCALDVNCMAPEGSRLMNCPGCHRYDQSALTTIASFFYGNPKNVTKYKPPFAFLKTDSESKFFNVKRGQSLPKGQVYFT